MFNGGEFFANTGGGAAGESLPWTPTTAFTQGQILLYEGNLYEVIADYTSGAAFVDDIDNGDLSMINKIASIVWKEGGATDGNIFGSEAEIRAFLESFDGDIFVYLDDSVSAPEVTANMDVKGVRFRSSKPLTPVTLTVKSGANLINPHEFSAVDLIFEDTATASYTVSEPRTVFDDKSSIIANGSVVPIVFSGGFPIISFSGGSSLKKGAIETVESQAGATVTMPFKSGANLETNSLTGAGNFSIFETSDSGTVSQTQTGANTSFAFSGKASKTNYSPGVPGDWVTSPTLVNEGLDQLAAGKVRFKVSTFDYTDFTAGGAVASYSITGFSLPTGYKLKDVEIEMDPGTPDGFGGVGTAFFEVGISGNLDKYIVQNIDFAGFANFESAEPNFIESKTSDTDVLITLYVDTTVDQLTSGTGRIRYRYISTTE